MKRKRFSVEQIVAVLKQVEVGVPVVEVCRQVGISEQTFYRWKKQFVGLEIDQVRQLKQLQKENGKLKKLVADLSLDKAMLQDVLSKNSKALAHAFGGAVPVRGICSESAAGVSYGAGLQVDGSISEQARTENRSSAADSRDRPGANQLWVWQDPGAAEARGLEGRQKAGLPVIP